MIDTPHLQLRKQFSFRQVDQLAQAVAHVHPQTPKPSTQQLISLVETLSRQNASLNQQLEKAKDEREGLREEVDQLKGRCDQLREIIKKKDEEGREGEDEQKKARELATYLNQYMDRNSEVHEEYKKNFNLLKNQNKKLQELNTSLMNQLKQQKQVNNTFLKHHSSSIFQPYHYLQSSDKSQQSIKELHNFQKSCYNQFSQYGSQLAKAKNTIHLLQKEIQMLEGKIAQFEHLQQKYLSQIKSKDKKIDSLKQAFANHQQPHKLLSQCSAAYLPPDRSIHNLNYSHTKSKYLATPQRKSPNRQIYIPPLRFNKKCFDFAAVQ